MQSSFKLLCIRHAESEYNLAQRVARNSTKEVHLGDEDFDVKFDTGLMDCRLSQAGVE
jgi:hypothetical protein